MKKIFALNRKNRKTDADQQNTSSAKAFERCVLCGRVTDVPLQQPISERSGYVIGAGQLCQECCRDLYGTVDLVNTAESEIC